MCRLTYIIVSTLALFLSQGVDGRVILVWALVVIGAARLGTILFTRIKKAGKDDRFDEIKSSFIRCLNVWTLQGLGIILTAATAWVVIITANRKELVLFAPVGFLVWAYRFVIEIAADHQKGRFIANPENKGKFIHTGLWSRSRHPNYLGEITL